MKSLLLKLDTSVYTQWKAAAAAGHLNVSEWIRYQCNNAVNGVQISMVPTEIKLSDSAIAAVKNLGQPESEKGNGSADRENVQRVSEAPVSGRRTAPTARRGRPRGKGKLRAIEDVAHGAVRKNGLSRPEPLASTLAGIAELVTCENFAEIMATIKPDEVDRWARSLPPEVLPEHKGTAHVNTCLCKTCLQRRKDLAIPYGGPGEKKKSRFDK